MHMNIKKLGWVA